MARKPLPRRARVHLAVAAATVAVSPVALIWWRNSILFVIAISLATQLYAALSAVEGADDSAVTGRLDRIEALLKDRP
jgi:hypothetical protein